MNGKRGYEQVENAVQWMLQQCAGNEPIEHLV